MTYIVYVKPHTQTWADGSPVLWGWTVKASSEREARKIVQNSRDCKGMPIIFSYSL